MTDVRRQKSEVSKGTALSAMLSALCLLGAILLATSYLAEAQQPKTKVPEIGVFFPESPSAYASYVEAFRQGLQELGYIVGQSILIEYRYAEGKPDRLTEFAAELVRLKVDVIVVVGGTLAATKRATSTIPIVVGSAGDLVGGGYVASLARPGGNIKRKKEKPEDKTEISEIDAPPLSKELKKRWSYFIRKVYETDPLICFYN